MTLLLRRAHADSDDSRRGEDAVESLGSFESFWVMKTPGTRRICEFLLTAAAAAGSLMSPDIILRILALSRMPMLFATAAILCPSSEKELKSGVCCCGFNASETTCGLYSLNSSWSLLTAALSRHICCSSSIASLVSAVTSCKNKLHGNASGYALRITSQAKAKKASTYAASRASSRDDSARKLLFLLNSVRDALSTMEVLKEVDCSYAAEMMLFMSL